MIGAVEHLTGSIGSSVDVTKYINTFIEFNDVTTASCLYNVYAFMYNGKLYECIYIYIYGDIN